MLDFHQTHLLFSLSSGFLRRQQSLVVGASLCSEVDLRQGVLHQSYGQIHTLDVKPANKVSCFIHAFHLHFHLVERERDEAKELMYCIWD